MPQTRPRPEGVVIASWILAALALIAILHLHLLSALFAGLLVFELVHGMAPFLQRRFFSERSRLAAVLVLSTLIVGALFLIIFGAIAFFRSDAGNLGTLLQRMADILDSARGSLPAVVVEHLPTDAEDLRNRITAWLRGHAPEIQIWAPRPAASRPTSSSA